MSLIHNWSRNLPRDCNIHYTRFESDWVIFGLYCTESIEEISIDTISGKLQKRRSSEAELKGFSEFRKNFYVLTCYRGLNKRIWNRVERSLNSKIICRQNICVTASLKPERVLEIKIIDIKNEDLETISIENTYDFHIGSSLDLIAVTTTGIRQEYSATVLIDPATLSVLDHLTGFGGYIVESTDYLLIYGFSKGKYVTKMYSSHGEEVLEIDGIPVLVPYNPLTHRVHRDKLFDTKFIGIIDKNDIKIVDPSDFSIILTCIKPPFTRGVLSVDLEMYSVTVYSVFGNKPLIIKYDSSGAPVFISHELSGFRYGLFTSKMATIYVERGYGETRVYRIVDNMLIHEDSFGPGVFPIFVRGDTVILTDSKKISSYSME